VGMIRSLLQALRILGEVSAATRRPRDLGRIRSGHHLRQRWVRHVGSMRRWHQQRDEQRHRTSLDAGPGLLLAARGGGVRNDLRRARAAPIPAWFLFEPRYSSVEQLMRRSDASASASIRTRTADPSPRNKRGGKSTSPRRGRPSSSLRLPGISSNKTGAIRRS
jgi:hypothetical protein